MAGIVPLREVFESFRGVVHTGLEGRISFNTGAEVRSAG